MQTGKYVKAKKMKNESAANAIYGKSAAVQ